MIQTSDNICTTICKTAYACHIICVNSNTNCCLECHATSQALDACSRNQLKGIDYFKFILLYHKNKKAEGKENG